jgi:hypothetical protein
MLVHDIYSQPNAADPVLDERTVLGLARRHGVRGSALTGVDEAGGEARVYVIDETLVVKVQRPHRLRPRTSLEKEASSCASCLPTRTSWFPISSGTAGMTPSNTS